VLFENPETKSAAGAGEEHADGRRADPEPRADLGGIEAVDVRQLEYLALSSRKILEIGAHEFGKPVAADPRAVLVSARVIDHCASRGVQQSVSPRFDATAIRREIACDAIEPAGKPAAPFVLANMIPQFEQDELRHVLGLVGVVREAARPARTRWRARFASSSNARALPAPARRANAASSSSSLGPRIEDS